MAQTFFHTAMRDDGETEFEAEIAVHSWGSPAQTYGPAEHCHPAEAPEVEVIDAWLSSDSSRADAPRIELTDTERQRVETDFLENPPEPDHGDDW